MEVAASASDAGPSTRKRPPPPGQVERSSKRRRLGQASVLCMRELFRAVVKDGEISDVERVMLQNVATLLSQVDGNTWVSFVDTQGSVMDLTPQQVKRLRPFLDTVARDLREHEVQLSFLDADNREVLDCLQLASVPWADGITASELLSCCGPEKELIFSGWLTRVTAVLPTRYMFRSRVRELLNHYYLRRGTAPAGRSFLEWAEDRGIPVLAAAAPCLRLSAAAVGRAAASAAAAVAAPAVRLAAALAHAWATASASVAAVVVATAAGAVAAAGPTVRAAVPLRVLQSREPLWPAVRFFLAALLHGQLRKLCRVLVLITSWRVALCLAACSGLFGWLFHPVVWIAQHVLNWNKSSRIWGCACSNSDNPSILSWIPVRFSDLLVQILKLVRLIPVLGSSMGSFVHAVDVMHPMLSFICDFTFSVGIAKGLATVVDIADERAQQKLVWMSMNISRLIREGPVQDDCTPPIDEHQTHPEASMAPEAATSETQDSPSRLPWNEEATWNLFDTE